MEFHPFLLVFELRRTVAALERALSTRLVQAGWPDLTVNQVLLFAHLDPDGVTPAELARRMGMSRQSMQKNLDRLRDSELVAVQPHPDDRRSTIVTKTAAGERFTATAARLLDGFERRLEAALGTDVVNRARQVSTADLDRILQTGQEADGH